MITQLCSFLPPVPFEAVAALFRRVVSLHFEHAAETPAQKMISAPVSHYQSAYLNKKEPALVTENPVRNRQGCAKAKEQMNSDGSITQGRRSHEVCCR